MLSFGRTVLLVLLLALAAASPALAAYTYNSGDNVALRVGVSTAYTIYWFSDRDGFLMSGNPLTTTRLSTGLHKITYLIYRTSSLVYRGTVDVEVKAAAAVATSTGSSAGTGTGTTSSGIVTPGEFEPVKGLLLGTADAYSVEDMYPYFLDALRGVVPTTIYVDNQYVQYELEDIFAQYGVDDADYSYVIAPVDSIWMRDYGPLFAKKGGALEVVDILYYPERPNDDAIPAKIASRMGITRRSLRYYWEGGNFTADGKGNVFASDVLYTRNSASQSTISSNVGAAFGGRLNILDHMRDDGGTGHIDMFVLMTGPKSFLLNKFASGHQNASRMDNHAARLESMGYTVTRLDLADTRFSSYTNGLIVNNIALVPTYGNSTRDSRAIAAYRAAGYTTYPIDCRRIIQWAGAIHCITMTVPR